MIWLKLTSGEDGEPIWVNIDAAMTLIRSGDTTHIRLGSGAEAVITVNETPDHIIGLVEEQL